MGKVGVHSLADERGFGDLGNMHPYAWPRVAKGTFARMWASILLGRQAAAQATWPWESRDIGAVSRTGGSNVTATGVEVAGAGGDIWGSADAFHFRAQLNAGNVEVVTRVLAMDFTHAWAKAG